MRLPVSFFLFISAEFIIYAIEMNLCLTIILAVFRAVFVPAQFADKPFDASSEGLAAVVSGCEDYFNAQFRSYQAFSFDCAPLVTLEGEERHYLANPWQAVVEAFTLADPEVDYAAYDAFVVLCPGEALPAHTFYLEDYGVRLVLDGIRINQYALSTEQLRLGAMCHEMMHILGCPDFYDTDGEGSGGVCPGLGGSFALMDQGNESGGGADPPDLCAPELEATGLVSPLLLEAGIYEVKCDRLPHFIGRIDTYNEGEYYLVECREGGRLVYYHIDRSDSEAGYSDRYRRVLTAAERWRLNEVNCRPDRPLAYVSESIVASLVIDDVRVLAPDLVGFVVREPLDISRLDIYQDGVIVSWVCEDEDRSCTVELHHGGKVVETRSVVRGASGGFSTTFDGLSPLGDYLVTVRTPRCVTSGRFRTKAYNSKLSPYIYLGTEGRDSRGVFEKGSKIPLRVYNAPDAGRISWYFNSKPVTCAEDGYFTLDESGELRAEWGTQRIIKKITVR